VRGNAAQPQETSMKTILVVLALVTVTPTVRAANGVTPGQFVIEPATLICLGFEWDIIGDENRNATVEVSYRVSGQTAWIDGMPLLRMGGERIMRAPYTAVVSSRAPRKASGRLTWLPPLGGRKDEFPTARRQPSTA